MQASQLDSFKNVQEQADQERVKCVEHLKEKQSHLPHLQDQVFEWEEKYKKCQSVSGSRYFINHYDVTLFRQKPNVYSYFNLKIVFKRSTNYAKSTLHWCMNTPGLL